MQPWKQSDTAESRVVGGAITIASLSPHTSIWHLNNSEAGPSNVPDALNYRVGPQPGGALCVPDLLNNREGPQAREPSKCLNRWNYRERMARGLLITSYKRLKKRPIGS